MPAATAPGSPLLVASNIEKCYGGRTVLRLRALTVASGEVVALIGPSGSGKTTLLNVLSGIDTADAGEVIWHLEGTESADSGQSANAGRRRSAPVSAAARDLAQAQARARDDHARTLFRRRHLGIVFQFYNLLPTLTVAENVLVPLRLNHIVDADAVALERLRTLGLGDRLDAYPDALSGGEQQRVAIARALAHAPAMVLADEPTGNLDAAAAETVTTMLFASVRAAGSSLIVATHAARVAAGADRIVDLAAAG